MIHHKSSLFACLFLVASLYGTAQTKHNQYFDFGTKNTASNATHISEALVYDENKGYGFDFNTASNVKFSKKALITTNSVYFSVSLPEGFYKVDLVLGDKKYSETTIKAESRRLMLKELKVDKKDSRHVSFTVNVRSTKIDVNNYIRIKDRDKNQLNWDDKLTIEFSGTPAIQSLSITPTSNITTIFLAGDSTVTDQDVEPWASWGQFFTNYLTDEAVVANYAESGSSLSAFKAVKRLDKILSIMKPGDYLFIEFAHNDEKQKGEGIGPWESYTKYLKEYITKALDKGGIPVLCTPTQRRAFNANGSLKETHGDFPDAMRKVAKDLNVPLIDITKMTTDMYESWGDEPSRLAFVQYPANTFPGQTEKLEDNTHFNSFGANEIAKCVVQGIKDLNLGLAKYLRPNIPQYNPKNPDKIGDWTLPMSTRFEIKKPDGN
ncbi:rhamnogalacturonan acetylesterase [Aestuariibaculum suncheonense]|uniref:Rhamnogalacturonan acetylesterase n=1 Tax=Aestuariibaculum suncheonense TaxID=1028745 RepID=A0A8J6U9W0_9FLAO|nr:rhamnogalacturonan acetylesterase [Aestuariibaculum suncheonense]MBD0834180.1 rhamnogalacturonan acetylesterase [Aestuariibaculum suncheonense]